MKICELVSRAFVEIDEEYRDPIKIHTEIGTSARTLARDLLQEHSGYVLTARFSRLAARCAVCGPLAAVAGYGMERFLINHKSGD